jgi:hypothetical protein
MIPQKTTLVNDFSKEPTKKGGRTQAAAKKDRK